VTIQKNSTKDAMVLTCAHQGTTSGFVVNEIIDQSSVMTLMPRPETVPNSWLTTTFFGAAQHTQLNTESAVKKYPGTQYQMKLHANAMTKKRSRLMCLRSRLP
jgi:hypothetical protein